MILSSGSSLDGTPSTYHAREGRFSSTTLLVSPRTEGEDLIGLEEPEDEILEQPKQHLPMHGRQRASRHAGGKKPLRGAGAVLIGKA